MTDLTRRAFLAGAASLPVVAAIGPADAAAPHLPADYLAKLETLVGCTYYGNTMIQAHRSPFGTGKITRLRFEYVQDRGWVYAGVGY